MIALAQQAALAGTARSASLIRSTASGYSARM